MYIEDNNIYSGIWSPIRLWVPKWLNPECYFIWSQFKNLEDCARVKSYEACRSCFEPKTTGEKPALIYKAKSSLQECIDKVNASDLPTWDKEYNICLCKYAHASETGVRKCVYQPPDEYAGKAPQILPVSYEYWAKLFGLGTAAKKAIDDTARSVTSALFGDAESNEQVNTFIRILIVCSLAYGGIKLVKGFLRSSYLRKPLRIKERLPHITKAEKTIKIPYPKIERRKRPVLAGEGYVYKQR